MMRSLLMAMILGVRLLGVCSFQNSFSTIRSAKPTVTPSSFKQSIISALRATTPNKAEPAATYSTIFDFSKDDSGAVEKFERIDDAIMGGISLSSMKQLPGESFSRWSGVCRLDGGGFCGTRTLPFEEPLKVGDAEGFYILCRLTSDDEPERRVWKMTTRVEQSRGEQLYQAMYELPKTPEGEWSRVLVPFSSFVQVRGPRVVEGAPALNTTSGLFQVGLSLSKFQIASSASELENFRPGFFELQIKEIGVFRNETSVLAVDTPTTLTKEAVEKKRPIMLKILFPLAKILFNEKRRRRDSALRILKTRGLTRLQAINFGLARRACARGKIVALFQVAGMMLGDIVRSSFLFSLKLLLVYPLIAIRKAIAAVGGKRSPKKAAK